MSSDNCIVCSNNIEKCQIISIDVCLSCVITQDVNCENVTDVINTQYIDTSCYPNRCYICGIDD